jgi:H+/Cl- antiporter ClcA
MPTFLVGAVWGRFIARIIDHASRSGGWDGVDIPSYTLIGAVAFTSGTHSGLGLHEEIMTS